MQKYNNAYYLKWRRFIGKRFSMFIINYIKYKLDEEIFIINGNYMEKYIIDDKLIR